MKRVYFKKWAKLALVIAVFAILLVLPQPIQQYTAYGQGYGYGYDDSGPPPPSGGGVGSVTTSGGVFTSSVSFQSSDQNLTVDIPQGTTGTTAAGDPLPQVRITPVSVPPAPPADMGFIGLTYDLEPDGATFDPPITITFTYNPAWIPAGLGPENLTVGYYDTDSGQWVMLGASDITIDPVTGTVSARVSHWTQFSVMAYAAPAEFAISGLTVPTTVGIAEKATISVMVENTGDIDGTCEVVLKINGKAVATKSVDVGGGESKSVSFVTVHGEAGSYSVEIDGQTGTFSVKEAELKPVVIQTTVPSITVPSTAPAPTAPSVPAVPAPVPTPTPWLAIIISLVASVIVAVILVWQFGFRST
jgi:hypothetical protein